MKKILIMATILFSSLSFESEAAINFTKSTECNNCSLAAEKAAAARYAQRGRDGHVYVFNFEDVRVRLFTVKSILNQRTGRYVNFAFENEVPINIEDAFLQLILVKTSLDTDVVIPPGESYGLTTLNSAYNIIDCNSCTQDLSDYVLANSGITNVLLFSLAQSTSILSGIGLNYTAEIMVTFPDGSTIMLEVVGTHFQVVEGSYRDAYNNPIGSSGRTIYQYIEGTDQGYQLLEWLQLLGYELNASGPMTCSFSCEGVVCRLSCTGG